MPDELQAMTDAQRSEYYSKLAKSAWDRYQSRRDVEWKVTLGMHTLFAAATLGAATLNWPVGIAGILFALGFSVAVLLVYGLLWAPYMAETARRDQLTCYYWESGIHSLLKRKIPPFLDPSLSKLNPSNLWVRMPENPETPPDNPPNYEESQLRKIHRSQICQLITAGVLAGAFVIVVLIKNYAPERSGQPKIAVEGAFEVDSASKIRLGN
jgi:hypothetical protein